MSQSSTRSPERPTSAAGGDGPVVVIEGPAGIGKSRLVEAGCHACDERGFTLLRARGGELERDFASRAVAVLGARAQPAHVPRRPAPLRGVLHLRVARALAGSDGTDAALHGVLAVVGAAMPVAAHSH